MQLHPNEFFPDHATWPFFEQSALERVVIELKTLAAGERRVLEFSRPPGHRFRAFFDRMTVTPNSLELNRVRMFVQTLDIQPPLVINSSDQHDHVADLFPGIDGLLGPTIKPYDGTVIFRNVQEIPRPGSATPDLLWSIGIASRGQDRQIVFRALFQFLRSAGLIEYVGDVYGSFFIYRRTDLPELFPPPPPLTTHPQPAAPPRLPNLHPRKPENRVPPVEYHVRVAKEVFDAENDPRLLPRLKERAKEERYLANILVRHDMVKRDEPLVKVLREEAKTDRELMDNLKHHHLLDDDAGE